MDYALKEPETSLKFSVIDISKMCLFDIFHRRNGEKCTNNQVKAKTIVFALRFPNAEAMVLRMHGFACSQREIVASLGFLAYLRVNTQITLTPRVVVARRQAYANPPIPYPTL